MSELRYPSRMDESGSLTPTLERPFVSTRRPTLSRPIRFATEIPNLLSWNYRRTTSVQAARRNH